MASVKMQNCRPSFSGGESEIESVLVDDEAGYGQLSKIESLELAEAGDYVIEITSDPTGDNDFSSPRQFRILLTEEAGTVDPPLSGELQFNGSASIGRSPSVARFSGEVKSLDFPNIFFAQSRPN